jgi:hypothetical protein
LIVFCAVLYPSEESNLFTLEVVHNGFFCGLRDNLEYVVSSVDHFDYLTGDTWSMDWMNEILTSLGLARDGKLHLYWCLPNKDIREGLVPLDCDAVIRRMARASLKEKTLVAGTKDKGLQGTKDLAAASSVSSVNCSSL